MTPSLAQSTPPDPNASHDDVGYELGWDHARHGIVPPADHLHPLSPVRQGWQAGRGRFAQRSLRADRYVHRWLTLRLHAWRLGQVFDAQHVNAALLRRIDVGRCPITREAFSDDAEATSGASITRVNPLAAWASGNLAVISRAAEQCRADRSASEVMRVVQRLESAATQHVDGMTAEQWARLAVWCAFATPLPHHQVAQLPLLVLPSQRLRVVNAAQSLQVLLSVQVTRAGHPRRCAALAALMPTAETRHAFHTFMHTLLARRLARGRIDDAVAERHAVEDLWREPLLNRRWQRLVLRLTDTDCEHLVRSAVERDLAGPRLRWLPQAAATDGWALRSRDRATAEANAPSFAPAGNRSAIKCGQADGPMCRGGASLREAPVCVVANA